jgi:hypothetical protein
MFRNTASRRLLLIAAAAFAAVIPVRAQAPTPTPPRLPQGPPGTVTLPVADYDRLVDRAAQQSPAPDTPPIPAIVARAEVGARVEGTAVRGTLRLDGEVFQRGAIKVPLVTGATLIDARADGLALPLLHEGNVHSAILEGPAAFAITLDWAAPLSTLPGRAGFTLPQPSSGTVSVAIDLPGDPTDVRIKQGLITGRTAANGRTTIDLTLVPGGPAELTWSVREAAQPAPADTRILADLRSLVTIADADLRMAALIDLTVVRGEPRAFDVLLPAGYELISVTGGTLDRHEARGSTLALQVRDPAVRRHQFLVTMEQSHAPGSFKGETAFPTVAGAQRETGEVAIEGVGAVDVNATGDEQLRRMDVRETHASLRALARQPLLAAFRYQRRPAETRTLSLDVRRFADAPVIAAAAEHASATTLVTSEGRMLTELSLWLRNRAQPFMKVSMPAGATLLSAEVAGQTARPVVGADGTRIPLLRAGLNTDAPYVVSFVYLHAGDAFAKRGDVEVRLPQVDVPVSMLEWELYLPGNYKAKPFDGNVIPVAIVERAEGAGGSGGGSGRSLGIGSGRGGGLGGGIGGGYYTSVLTPPPLAVSIGPGQIVGRVSDPAGGALPGATITVSEGSTRLQAVANAEGHYAIHGVPTSEALTVTGEMAGFVTVRRTFAYDQRARRVDFHLPIGTVSETVTVQAEAPLVDDRSFASAQNERRLREQLEQQPSQNVLNLQRRVAGVLPVRMDVPRSGIQHRFVRPLVIDEATHVSFRYKSR